MGCCPSKRAPAGHGVTQPRSSLKGRRCKHSVEGPAGAPATSEASSCEEGPAKPGSSGGAAEAEVPAQLSIFGASSLDPRARRAADQQLVGRGAFDKFSMDQNFANPLTERIRQRLDQAACEEASPEAHASSSGSEESAPEEPEREPSARDKKFAALDQDLASWLNEPSRSGDGPGLQGVRAPVPGIKQVAGAEPAEKPRNKKPKRKKKKIREEATPQESPETPPPPEDPHTTELAAAV